MKRFKKVIFYLFGFLFLFTVVGFLWLWMISPGISSPILDTKGEQLTNSISTIEKVAIGGLEQSLIIRGADKSKPLILYLHGGPGSPEFAFMKKYNSAIENDFVMVYWEQRGSGKSYSKEIPVNTMNLNQFIEDTRVLSEILIKRFNKKKIYLLGHSWGSALGIQTVAKYPDYYYAYLGVGQVADQYKAEKISFEWVKQQAQIRQDKKAIDKLSKINFPTPNANGKDWMDYLMIERQYVTKYGGGASHNMTSMLPVLATLLNTKEYTISDKINYMKGSLFSLENLWEDVVKSDLNTKIDSIQIPVYVFQGVHDYQTPYAISKSFFDQLKASKKQFFSFENSAHSPILEEPKKFNTILKKISKDLD